MVTAYLKEFPAAKKGRSVDYAPLLDEARVKWSAEANIFLISKAIPSSSFPAVI